MKAVLLAALLWAAAGKQTALEPALCDLCDCTTPDILCQGVRLPAAALAAPAQSLTLTNCSLPLLTAADLAALPNLTELRAEHSPLRLAPGALAPLPRLLLLSAESAGLRAPPAEACGACPRLRRISLAGNRLTGLLRAPFAACARLRALNLSGNLLRLLDTTAFTGLTALTELDLSRNELGRLVPEVFYPMTSLRRLYLDGNRVSVFGPEFVGLLAARPALSASLGNNPLRCACGELRDGARAARRAGLTARLPAGCRWDALAALPCPGDDVTTRGSAGDPTGALDLRTGPTRRTDHVPDQHRSSVDADGADSNRRHYPRASTGTITGHYKNDASVGPNSTKSIHPLYKPTQPSKTNSNYADLHSEVGETVDKYEGSASFVANSTVNVHPNSTQTSNIANIDAGHQRSSVGSQQSRFHNNNDLQSADAFASSSTRRPVVPDRHTQRHHGGGANVIRDTVSVAPARPRSPEDGNPAAPGSGLGGGWAEARVPSRTVAVVAVVCVFAILGCGAAGLLLILLMKANEKESRHEDEEPMQTELTL